MSHISCTHKQCRRFMCKSFVHIVHIFTIDTNCLKKVLFSNLPRLRANVRVFSCAWLKNKHIFCKDLQIIHSMNTSIKGICKDLQVFTDIILFICSLSYMFISYSFLRYQFMVLFDFNWFFIFIDYYNSHVSRICFEHVH